MLLLTARSPYQDPLMLSLMQGFSGFRRQRLAIFRSADALMP
jgi:hypothetical protein